MAKGRLPGHGLGSSTCSSPRPLARYVPADTGTAPIGLTSVVRGWASSWTACRSPTSRVKAGAGTTRHRSSRSTTQARRALRGARSVGLRHDRDARRHGPRGHPTRRSCASRCASCSCRSPGSIHLFGVFSRATRLAPRSARARRRVPGTAPRCLRPTSTPRSSRPRAAEPQYGFRDLPQRRHLRGPRGATRTTTHCGGVRAARLVVGFHTTGTPRLARPGRWAVPHLVRDPHAHPRSRAWRRSCVPPPAACSSGSRLKAASWRRTARGAPTVSCSGGSTSTTSSAAPSGTPRAHDEDRRLLPAAAVATCRSAEADELPAGACEPLQPRTRWRPRLLDRLHTRTRNGRMR